jgi:hypothetical protein
MSSVKRRKVDADVPLELSKKKKRAIKEKAPVPESPEASPDPALIETPKPETEEEEITKTFKDLVR